MIEVWLHLDVPEYVDDVGRHDTESICFTNAYTPDSAKEFAARLAGMHNPKTTRVEVIERKQEIQKLWASKPRSQRPYGQV